MTATARPAVTVASYNIHRGRGLDRRLDLARIAAVLAEVDADLVGLQEVFRPQAERLAETLGMTVTMGVTRTLGAGPFGNAVLSRLAVQSARTFDLTRRRREPRGGMRIAVTLAGHRLRLFNVHLGLGVRERAEQIALLIGRRGLREAGTGWRILVGDLNEWFPGPVGRALRRELHGPRSRRTHPAPAPLFALDRIYWDRELEAERFHVHRSRLSRVASDHLPVVARLVLPEPGLAHLG